MIWMETENGDIIFTTFLDMRLDHVRKTNVGRIYRKNGSKIVNYYLDAEIKRPCDPIIFRANE